MRRVLQELNTREVDVLNTYADLLASVITSILNLSLEQPVVLTCLKRSTMVPVPKNASPGCLNDYHPLALNLVVSALRTTCAPHCLAPWTLYSLLIGHATVSYCTPLTTICGLVICFLFYFVVTPVAFPEFSSLDLYLLFFVSTLIHV